MVERDSSAIYVLRLANFATIDLNSATETRQRRFVMYNDVSNMKVATFRFYRRGYPHNAIARSNLARKVRGLKSRV